MHRHTLVALTPCIIADTQQALSESLQGSVCSSLTEGTYVAMSARQVAQVLCHAPLVMHVKQAISVTAECG